MMSDFLPETSDQRFQYSYKCLLEQPQHLLLAVYFLRLSFIDLRKKKIATDNVKLFSDISTQWQNINTEHLVLCLSG